MRATHEQVLEIRKYNGASAQVSRFSARSPPQETGTPVWVSPFLRTRLLHRHRRHGRGHQVVAVVATRARREAVCRWARRRLRLSLLHIPQPRAGVPIGRHLYRSAGRNGRGASPGSPGHSQTLQRSGARVVELGLEGNRRGKLAVEIRCGF